mgnify:CR=1 FL=1
MRERGVGATRSGLRERDEWDRKWGGEDAPFEVRMMAREEGVERSKASRALIKAWWPR